jgi:hypothetical protein
MPFRRCFYQKNVYVINYTIFSRKGQWIPWDRKPAVRHALKRRIRAFQGMFHTDPDYAFRYGWSEMLRDVTEIDDLAIALRE